MSQKTVTLVFEQTLTNKIDPDVFREFSPIHILMTNMEISNATKVANLEQMIRCALFGQKWEVTFKQVD